MATRNSSAAPALSMPVEEIDGVSQKPAIRRCKAGMPYDNDVNPYSGPLLKAAKQVLEETESIPAAGDEYLTWIEARRIAHGSDDVFVASLDADSVEATLAPKLAPVINIDDLDYLLTPEDLARLFRTTVTAIYARAERGQIPGRVGQTKKLLFHRDAIKREIERQAFGRGRRGT